MNTDEFWALVDELGGIVKNETEYLCVVHPDVWNGYWSIRTRIPILVVIGRKLRNRTLYSWGRRVEWITGLKELIDERED